jgi:NAD(P)H-hydrate epimerase
MNYLSIAEIRQLEQKTIAAGVTELELMERAGCGAAAYIQQKYPGANFNKVSVFCGKGNNAGDGFVVARELHNVGYAVRLVLLSDPTAFKEPTKTVFANIGIPTIPAKQTAEVKQAIMGADLIIDAILGIGLHGSLIGAYRDVVCALNHSRKPIIALDIPTGINGDKGVFSPFFIQAKETLTFIAPKTAMAVENRDRLYGKITVIDLGI